MEPQTPVLKRRRSIEEVRKIQATEPVLKTETPVNSPLVEEFLSGVRSARRGFFWVEIYYVVFFFGFVTAIFSDTDVFREIGIGLAIIGGFAAQVRTFRAVVAEARGSFEAAVVSMLKAIEKNKPKE